MYVLLFQMVKLYTKKPDGSKSPVKKQESPVKKEEPAKPVSEDAKPVDEQPVDEQPPAKKQRSEKQIAATEARKEANRIKKEEKLKAAEDARIAKEAKEKAMAEQKEIKRQAALEKRRQKAAERKNLQENTPSLSEHEAPPRQMEKMVAFALKNQLEKEGSPRQPAKQIKQEAQQMVREAWQDPQVRTKIEKTQSSSERRMLSLMFPGRRW